MISHGNLCAAFRLVASLGQQIRAAQKSPPKYPTPEGIPVHLAFLPFYHSLGLKAYAFRLFIGPPATVVILPKWHPDVLGPLVEKYKITDLFLVPSAMHQLLKSPTFAKADRKTIMSVMTGGSYLPPDLAARMLKMLPKGAVVREGECRTERRYKFVIFVTDLFICLFI
jgi:acyl-CoA synthetase (AMP-forming)/AMP-acid ligase II